mgnify:CR=1 FL=1
MNERAYLRLYIQIQRLKPIFLTQAGFVNNPFCGIIIFSAIFLASQACGIASLLAISLATLTEMVLRHNVGATITLDNVGIALVSETPGRVVVAIDPAQSAALTQEAASQKITLTKIGTTGGDSLVINGAKISLVELRKAHTETIPKLFG